MSQEELLKKGKIFKSDFDDGFESNNTDIEIDQGSVISLAKLQDVSTDHRAKVTTYHWQGKNYPIQSKETMSFLARRILNHNLSNGYTLITLIGHSGSGKSTFTGTIVHRLHKIADKLNVSYAINWYRRDAISKIDEIIPTLQKGVNRIVVFEDASWGDRELDEQEAKQLLARLTYVRHDLQANVIFLFQVHYSKALGPFLRDGDVVAITSISHIEKENFLKTFGWDNKGIINKFFKKYGSMNAESYWYSELDPANNIIYYAKQPFKLSLVSDFNSLHFTQYPRESCGYCEPHFTDIEQGKIIDSATERELFAQIADSYSITKLRMCLRFFAYFRTGAACLEPKTKSVMSRLLHYYEKHPDEWKNISDELRIGKSVDYVLRNRGLKIKHTREESRINKRAKNRLAERERRLREQSSQGSGPTEQVN